MTYQITLSQFNVERISHNTVDFIKTLRMAFGFGLKEAVDVKNLIRDGANRVVIETTSPVSRIGAHAIRNYIGRFDDGSINDSSSKFDDLITSLLAENRPEIAGAIGSIFEIYKKGA